MKKQILPFLVLFFALGSVSWADWTPGNLIGSISSHSNEVFGTAAWNDVTFSWNVSSSGSNWTYAYTFTDPYGAGCRSNPLKDLSHLIIQVPDQFASGNIKGGTDPYPDEGPASFSKSNGNPGMPAGEITGIKWQDGNWHTTYSGSVVSYTTKLVSDKSPIAGNFYAKSGKLGGGFVYAISGYQRGGINYFNNDIPVPNPAGGQAPEPITLVLYGLGFAGVGLYRRLRRSK